jgi:flagellar basal-body rod protein FlgF
VIRGLGASRLGMAVEQRRSEILAQNLANVNTAGFKRSVAAATEFAPILLQRLGDLGDAAPVEIGRLGNGAAMAQVALDQAPGVLEQTGSPLDVALIGPGLFTALGPNGVELTRQGQFTQNAEGQLVTVKGYPVLVGGQPVGRPGQSLTIEPDGEVRVGGQQVGRLDVVGADQPKFVVGSLERSNVDMATEMTDLVAILRTFQANQRAMQMQDQTLAKAVTELGSL